MALTKAKCQALLASIICPKLKKLGWDINTEDADTLTFQGSTGNDLGDVSFDGDITLLQTENGNGDDIFFLSFSVEPDIYVAVDINDVGKMITFRNFMNSVNIANQRPLPGHVGVLAIDESGTEMIPFYKAEILLQENNPYIVDKLHHLMTVASYRLAGFAVYGAHDE